MTDQLRPAAPAVVRAAAPAVPLPSALIQPRGTGVGEVVQPRNSSLPAEVQAALAPPAQATPAAPSSVAQEAPQSLGEWIGQTVAALGAAFLPVASYQLAHVESAERPWLWALVAAALAFSAPSVATWAHTWTSRDPEAFPLKAWGFSILLEGVMIAAATQWLSYGGLTILVLTNAIAAWSAYGATRAARR